MNQLCTTEGCSCVTLPFLPLVAKIQSSKNSSSYFIISVLTVPSAGQHSSCETHICSTRFNVTSGCLIKKRSGRNLLVKPGSHEVDTWSPQMIASSSHFLACSNCSQGQSCLLFPYWDTDVVDAAGVRRLKTWSWLAETHLTTSERYLHFFA